MYEVSDSAVAVKRRVTLDDVAKVAHVATSTASRALNRPGRINAETEALVRQVANDLGYERPEKFLATNTRIDPKNRGHDSSPRVSNVGCDTGQIDSGAVLTGFVSRCFYASPADR